MAKLEFNAGLTRGVANNLYVQSGENASGVEGTLTSYTIGSEPIGICAGPDGNLWVADYTGGKVWKVTTAGAATSYALSGANAFDVVAGSDGNLWVSDYTGFVWKVTTAGATTYYALSGAHPRGICSGSDGNLWIADYTGFVWKVTTAGAATSYALSGSSPYGICSGSDGNLWVADDVGSIWKVTTGGSVTQYTLPGSNVPRGVISGPDDNLWLVDGSNVWKVTTAGSGSSYSLPALSASYFICSADGYLWATDAVNNKVYKISTLGSVTTTYALPSHPNGICLGPDGNLWIAGDSGTVWQLTLAGDLSGFYPHPFVNKINGSSLGSTVPQSANILVADGTDWESVAMSGDVTITNTGATTVGKINGATLGTTTATDKNILIANGTQWQTEAMSGDVTITNTGATTVGKINGATLGTTTATDKNILIANGTQWQTEAMSGDVTITNTGATTINIHSNTTATPTDTTDQIIYYDQGASANRVCTMGQMLSYFNPAICNGRLTLATGTPITTTDQITKSTLYFTPYLGDKIAIYNATNWLLYTFTEVSLSLTGMTTTLPYDIFIYDNAGTLTLTKTAWTNATTRATALGYTNGILCNSTGGSNRYLGTIVATAATTTEDSAVNRYVWNYYNRVPRECLVTDNTAHNYNTQVWRAWDGAAKPYQFNFIVGEVEDALSLDLSGQVVPNSGFSGRLGIGINSTTSPSVQGIWTSNLSFGVGMTALPQLGLNNINSLEWGQTSGTTAFQFYYLYGLLMG